MDRMLWGWLVLAIALPVPPRGSLYLGNEGKLLARLLLISFATRGTLTPVLEHRCFKPLPLTPGFPARLLQKSSQRRRLLSWSQTPLMTEVELILSPARIVPSPNGHFFLAIEFQKCIHHQKPPSSLTLLTPRNMRQKPMAWDIA